MHLAVRPLYQKSTVVADWVISSKVLENQVYFFNAVQR